MKKWIGLALTALLLVSCGRQAAQGGQDVDIDLTKFSTDMAYSVVNRMLTEPQQYVGKTVRVAGGYSAFLDEATGNVYRVCMIADADGCSDQGMEFILAEGEYPELESDITVTGTLQTYEENGTQYCHLVDAKLE